MTPAELEEELKHAFNIDGMIFGTKPMVNVLAELGWVPRQTADKYRTEIHELRKKIREAEKVPTEERYRLVVRLADGRVGPYFEWERPTPEGFETVLWRWEEAKTPILSNDGVTPVVEAWIEHRAVKETPWQRWTSTSGTARG